MNSHPGDILRFHKGLRHTQGVTYIKRQTRCYFKGKPPSFVVRSILNGSKLKDPGTQITVKSEQTPPPPQEEAEELDICESRVAGKNNNYSFDVSEWINIHHSV